MTDDPTDVGGDNTSNTNSNNNNKNKEKGEIVEFNALPAFPNSVKWNSHNNKIALQISDSTFVVNVHSDSRDVVQWEPLDTQEAYATMNYHLKDRYIYHPGMFARYQTRYCRCSEWSPMTVILDDENTTVSNDGNDENNNHKSSGNSRKGTFATCFLAVCSTDHLLRIYSEPDKSYDRKWKEVYDVRVLLKAACQQFYESELSSVNNQFQPQTKRLKLSLPPQQLSFSNDGSNGGSSSNATEENESAEQTEADDNVTGSRKLTDSFLNVLVAGFVKLSNFLEPEELEKKKRRYSEEETKFIDEKMNQLFKENEALMKKYKLNAKTLKANLLKRMKVRTRTIANKKRNGESLSDLENGDDTASATTTDVNFPMTDILNQSQSQTETESVVVTTPDTATQSAETGEQQTTDVSTPRSSQNNKTAFTPSTSRKRVIRPPVTSVDNIETPEEFVHIEHISDIMCIAWSHPITESDLYFACGNKTGHIAIMRFNPNKQQILTVVCYFKAHFSFVTSMCFLRAGPSGCCLVTGSSDGSVNFWTVPLLIGDDSDILLSLDCVFPFADLPNSIPNTFITPDHIPINFMTRYEYNGSSYLCIVKGCCSYISKLATNLSPTWKKALEGHSSIITGVAPLMCHYHPDKDPLLLIYSASYDGSLVLWNVNDADGSSEKNIIVAQDCAYPIWGCSLSPNQTYVALLRERPPQIANRADLEDRHKTKLFVFPVFEHLDKIIPDSDNRIIDYYYATLIQIVNRGIDSRLNPFDIVDAYIENLSTDQVITIVDKIINNLNSAQMLLQLCYLLLAHLTFKFNLILRALMVGGTSANTEQIQREYSAIGQRQFQAQNKLFYQNIMQMIRSFESAPTSVTDSMLLKCDWLLLYQSHSIAQCIKTDALSGLNEIGGLIAEDLQHLKSVYTRSDKSEQLVALIDRLIELCGERSDDTPVDASSVDTVLSEIKTCLPCRDSCPFCSETLKMSLEQVLTSQCPRHPRHKFNRDVFTFTIIQQPGAATCRGCGCKTQLTNHQSILPCPLCGNMFEHKLKVEL